MRVFELCWTWHEDYTPHLFTHPDASKDKEAFETDVKSLFSSPSEADLYFASVGDHWVGAQTWTEHVASRLHTLGYERVITVSVATYGAFIIERDDTGEGRNDDDIKFGNNFIGQDLLKRAMDHNERIRKDMEK